jgi:DNA-binding transcriptional regulator YiaG
MKAGSKYYHLYTYLMQSGQEILTLSFKQIEAILGRSLPPSARARRDWWGNRTSALQATSWQNAGYQITNFDLEKEQVTFTRRDRKIDVPRDAKGIVRWNADLIRALRQHMGVTQAELAEELGMRQQTVSEWETSEYAPTRATCKHLMLVAERSNFKYSDENE